MRSATARIATPMNPDERLYFQGLGARIADARHRTDLTQVQLADSLGISQPQLASYETGRRRVPVSMLPRLARLIDIPIETLIGESDERDTLAPSTVQRRTRRGPASRLERQLDAIAQLPKAEQRAVSTVLDAVLAQHGRVEREAAATA
jgi:transcriptional regulator with XRE-family HTH domain